MSSKLYDRVSQIVDDYMDAFLVPYSDLTELDAAERQELLNTIMDEVAIAIRPDDMEELVGQDEFRLEDIVESLELGDTVELDV